MIRKSQLGKRMMALFLCAALTFTSVVPTMASEVVPESSVVTQEAQAQQEQEAAVSEEQQNDTAVDDTAKENPPSENDTEKTGSGGDFQSSDEEAIPNDASVPDEGTVDNAGADVSAQEAPAADNNAAGEVPETPDAELPSAVPTEDTLPEEQPEQEVAVLSDDNEVASIEIWNQWPNNPGANKISKRYFCKDLGEIISPSDELAFMDASGNPIKTIWNGSFCSDSANGFTCVLKQDDIEITNPFSVETGTYTIEYTYGAMKASYPVEYFSLDEMQTQKLNPDGTVIQAVKSYSESPVLYTFTPELDGTYYFDGAPEIWLHNDAGFYRCKKATLVGGTTYYFRFGGIWLDGKTYQSYNVTIGRENAVVDFSVTDGNKQVIYKIDSCENDILKNWKITLTYNNDSKEYDLSKLHDTGYRTNASDFYREGYDDFQNNVTIKISPNGHEGIFPYAVGTYTMSISVEGVEKEPTYTIDVLDMMDDASWSGREITSGSQTVTLNAGESSKYYRFKPSESKKYLFQMDMDSPLYLSFYTFESGYRQNISSWPVNNAQTGKKEYSMIFDSSKVYYINLYRMSDSMVFESPESVSLDVSTIPSLVSASISTTVSEMKVAENTGAQVNNVSYVLTYDNEAYTTGNANGLISGLYNDSYWLKFQKVGDTKKYWFGENLEKGSYQLVLCPNGNDDIVLCTCEGFTLNVVEMQELSKGTLQLGENPIVATNFWDSTKNYYAFTPEKTGFYYFRNASGVGYFWFDEENNKQYGDGGGSFRLTEGTTYYFYFSGDRYDDAIDDWTYSYTVTLKKEKTPEVEIVPGNTLYMAYETGVFSDYVFNITDEDGNTSSYNFEYCSSYSSDGKYYFYHDDWNTDFRTTLRYELTEKDTEGFLFKGASSPGEYTLKIFDLNDNLLGTYTASVKSFEKFDWTDYTLTEGENTVLRYQNNPQKYYRFVSETETPYSFHLPDNWDVEIYRLTEDGLDWYPYESNWKDNGGVDVAFIAPANAELFFRFDANANKSSTKIVLKKCPTIEKVTLYTNNQTTTKVLANAADKNRVGWLKAELAYTNGVVNTVTVDDEGYADGEYNGLALVLTKDDGTEYAFTDALPVGTYTVRAKITGTDPIVYSENSYTITADTFEKLSATALTMGDNTIRSGATQYNELNYDCLYTFQPKETGSYRFSPAARIAVYTQNDDGALRKVGVYGSYKNGKDSTGDVIIPLDAGTTYYLSMTGYIRDSWNIKYYGWTMNISRFASVITKAEITGEMPYTTFYTGGYTKDEITASMTEALTSVQVSYSDGSTENVSVDNFEILYPEEMGNYYCSPGEYTLRVKLTIDGQSVISDTTFDITMLGGDKAKEWDVRSPLTVDYTSHTVKPGQAVLYRLTGLTGNTTYSITSRKDIEMIVSDVNDTIDGPVDCICWEADDLQNMKMEQEFVDEEEWYTWYIWIKPSASLNSFTVNAAVKEQVPVKTEIILNQDTFYANLAGYNYLDTNDIYFRFTYENGETYTRSFKRYDNAYFCDELLREYNIYELSKGNYTIEAYGKEINFTVDELDVNALPTITAETTQEIKPGFYRFTPEKTAPYEFYSADNSKLVPVYDVFVKEGDTWQEKEYAISTSYMVAGESYLIHVDGWSGNWRLGVVDWEHDFDEFTEEDYKKTVQTVAVDSDNLYYDTFYRELYCTAEVTFTDGTVKKISNWWFDSFKYLDYTYSVVGDTVTVYIKYKSSAAATADWIKCDPISIKYMTNHGAIAVGDTVKPDTADGYYTFTPDTDGWYQLDTTGTVGIAKIGWQSEDGYSGYDGYRQYLKAGKTYRVAVTLRDGATANITLSKLVNVPVSLTIDPASRLTRSFIDYAFTESADSIKITVTYGGGETEVLSGKEFRENFGNSIVLDKISDTRYTVRVSINGSDAADTCTLTGVVFEENAYTVNSDGILSYSGKDISYDGSIGFREVRLPMTLVIRPENSGIYVMSAAGDTEQISNNDMNSCGIIRDSFGRFVVDTNVSNMVYLEAGKTYYQALNAPYYDGEFTLTLTPIELFSSDCEHQYTSEITKPATCSEEGVETFTCNICGEEYTVPVKKLPHTEVTVNGTPATCTEDGLTDGVKCSACGEILKAQESIKALGHTEEVISGKPATCTEDGLTDGVKCSVCKEILKAQETIKAPGHTEEVISGKPATCTEDGLTDGVKCSVCKEILKAQESIKAPGHKEEVIPGKPATCTEDGLSDIIKCSVCKEILKKQEKIPATGHTEVVIKGEDATCIKDGLTDGLRCSVCGEILKKQESIPATGHTEEVIPGKAATCTEDGLTDGKRCTVCDEILVYRKRIPATGHTELTVKGKAATCSETGLTDGVKCSVCDIILQEQEIIPVVEHTPVVLPAQEKTCTQPGLTEGERCSVCGEILKAQDVDPATGHEIDITTWITDTTNNTKYHKCANCDIHFDTVEIDEVKETAVSNAVTTVNNLDQSSTSEDVANAVAALTDNDIKADLRTGTDNIMQTVESLENLVVSKNYNVAKTDSTVAENTLGITEVSVTGESVTAAAYQADTNETEKVLAAKINVEASDKEYEDNALAVNITMSIVDTANNNEVIEKEVQPKTPISITLTIPATVQNKVFELYHEKSDGTREPITYTRTGTDKITFIAESFSNYLFRTVNCNNAHSLVSSNDGRPATCIDTGLTNTQICSVCGETIFAQTVIPVLGHTEKTIKGYAATCLENGKTDGKECAVCHITLESQTDIPALGHTETTVPGTAATCISQGLTDGTKCSVCDEILVAQTTIPRTAHTEQVLDRVEPTCSAEGKTEGKKCSVCGEILVAQTAIPRIAHTEQVLDRVEPTCSAEGKTEGKKCSVCGEILVAQTAIPRIAHTEQKLDRVEPTCTAEGLTEGKKCSVCGEILTAQQPIPALGHAYKEISRTESTCTTNGSVICRCERCGDEKTETLPTAGRHTEEIRNVSAATCTTAGYTGDTYCKACGEKLASGTAIAALGHAFGAWYISVAPNAVSYGQQARVCSRCNHTETTTIDKLAGTGVLSITNFPLKVKQSVTLNVRNMAAGDYVVSWKSSNTKIATVTNKGKVTGKKKGSSTITATLASGVTVRTTVKVQTGTVKTTSISVNTRNITLKTKQGFQILATRNPATSQQGITYSSSNKKIATVNKKGYITGVKSGTATITVKSGSKSVKIKVKVEGVKTTDLKANRTEITLKKNKSFSWKVTRVPSNSSENITYSTSNKKVATVSSSGKIKAKKKGTATITAKSGSKKITIKVTVN